MPHDFSYFPPDKYSKCLSRRRRSEAKGKTNFNDARSLLEVEWECQPEMIFVQLQGKHINLTLKQVQNLSNSHNLLIAYKLHLTMPYIAKSLLAMFVCSYQLSSSLMYISWNNLLSYVNFNVTRLQILQTMFWLLDQMVSKEFITSLTIVYNYIYSKILDHKKFDNIFWFNRKRKKSKKQI